jgi:protoporphyrinogen oxidase
VSKKKVLIIGAGPAGLTAALELVRAGIQPIVIEADSQVGGISKTINFEGNRMDLGGHRFFSKSDWVMNWWQEILPVEMDSSTQSQLALSYQNQSQLFTPTKIATAQGGDRVMLIRPRLSRIYYLRKFFDYPVKLNANTIGNLGLLRMGKIGVSYGLAMVMPIKNERTLEDFLINRFGRELYSTFFKDYTEKVWGVPCAQISAEWGAQRIKGLSITKALLHAAKQVFGGAGAKSKNIETSLIEQFMYPKLGPGQLWEVVAEKVIEGGGQIFLNQRAVKIHRDGFNIVGADILDTATGNCRRVDCTEFISTIPVKELIENLQPSIDGPPLEIASALPYRDFITVGLLVPRMLQENVALGSWPSGMPADNWIYIQEPDVKLGRLQIFNNWSPAMVKDPATIFLGLEYFCTQGDALWNMTKDQLLIFAATELEKIGLIKANEVISGTVVKVPKAYPAYFGTYTRMPELRTFFAQFSNLYLVGRNGMHRYNNQDHSMVSAKVAVECILNPALNRDSIWDINVEQEYHEEK